jgi:uncharacterized protein (TIGR02145 family)
MKFHHSLLLAGLLFFANSTSWSQTDCNGYNPDVDDDNAITITDLLALLGLFEEVDTDNDGVWDSVDDCIGALDACGVCNGLGPTLVIGGSLVCPVYGCTDDFAINYLPASNVDDGSCIYGPAQCGGQNSITFGGYQYNLVGIGNQCWFSENLRTTFFSNGDTIPEIVSESDWRNLNSSAFSIYPNGYHLQYGFGYHYNYFAVVDNRGICPQGFHLPNEIEWQQLVDEVGGDLIAGRELKANAYSVYPWDGMNSVGFEALAGGVRHGHNGFWGDHGWQGYYWVIGSDFGLRAAFIDGGDGTFMDWQDSRAGQSVRCLMNEIMEGCNDPGAFNFDFQATVNDGSCDYCGSTSIVFNGDSYNLVSIGTQCWFKDNLKTSCYQNGDPIPGNLSNEDWLQTNSGAQAVFGNNNANADLYGRLYNWHAVSDERSICPNGYHVPSDEDWMQLESTLGMPEVDLQHDGSMRGNDTGFKLKNSPDDIPPWDGLNSSEFSALPGGHRHRNGGFWYLGQFGQGYYWSTSFLEDKAWFRYLYGGPHIGRTSLDHNNGFSVRCLKD